MLTPERLPAPVITVTVLFVFACWVVDIRSRRIPNLLSGSAVLAGLLLNIVLLGGFGLAVSLGGVLVTVVILLGPFALGGIGGGDVKMMAAIGALLGPVLALSALTAGMILGGAIMMIHLARIGRLRQTLQDTRNMVVAAVVTRSAAPLKVSANAPSAVSLPYSVPLGAGAIAVVAMARAFGPI